MFIYNAYYLYFYTINLIKSIILIDDFNINIKNFDLQNKIKYFIDTLYISMVPYIKVYTL